ncbi:hypothetical protein A2690_05190 [Candidatus Roizmanbacteria bacterium RIFCSPHIGHO2_01_FULL_39_12b]|uniref:Four helix bundle protein n=1 Tax=Candidatus Roizmanbacteria bacterium RIFCSPHIGHO2_01_FULL_39_12b TaxID=1802030 RepID=A0A1F7G940_9BACT|nr:MAG: hypothetical protein A2690_05190 [Candidatus Roizmanbacteria bacterium RIFCSPHIGHO2_01_FULL_39_12b]
MPEIHDFKDIEIWNISKKLSVKIYKICLSGRLNRDFGLKDQICRSSVSIPSNIAEGFGRGNNKEFIYFLRIAQGSCLEIITQIIIAFEVNYLSQNQKEELIIEYEKLSLSMAKFISYLRKNNKLKINKQ